MEFAGISFGSCLSRGHSVKGESQILEIYSQNEFFQPVGEPEV